MIGTIQRPEHLVQADDVQAAGREVDQQSTPGEVCNNNAHISELEVVTPSLPGSKEDT